MNEFRIEFLDEVVTFKSTDPWYQLSMKRSDWEAAGEPTRISVTIHANRAE